MLLRGHIIPAALTELSARLHGYCHVCLESLNHRLLVLHLHEQIIIVHKTEANDSPYSNHVTCSGVAWQTCVTLCMPAIDC